MPSKCLLRGTPLERQEIPESWRLEGGLTPPAGGGLHAKHTLLGNHLLTRTAKQQPSSPAPPTDTSSMTSAPSGTLSSPLLLLLQEKHPHRISKSSKPTSLPTGRQKPQDLHRKTYYVVGTRLPTLTLAAQESLFRPLFQLLQTAETGTSGTACVSQPEDGELAT